MNVHRKYYFIRFLIFFCVVTIFIFESSYAKRTTRTTDTSDVVRTEIQKTKNEREQYLQLQKNVRDYQEFLEKERSEHWRFINELYHERQWIAGIFLSVLALGFIFTLWRVHHNTKKIMREMLMQLSQFSQNKSVVVTESQTTEAPQVISQQTQMDSTVQIDVDEKKVVFDESAIIPKTAIFPNESLTHKTETISSSDEKAIHQYERISPFVFGFAEQSESTEVLQELITVLQSRGLKNIFVDKISPEIMSAIEKGNYDLLMCVYEPVKEQGIVMDKQLQGVVNALQYSDTHIPIIIYHDKKIRLSTWDEQAINKYDYALLTDSRLNFVNQIILTLQKMNGNN